jgi:hypothetical protein
LLRPLLGALGLSGAALLATLLLLEAGVRLFVPAELWRFRDGTHDWRIDPQLGWVNQSDLDVTSRGNYGVVRFRTNPDGLIPAEARRPKPPGVLRIMIFGDSMVVGRDLPQSEIYTSQLEAILRERGIRAEVINAGVLGYSTDQALLLMERWLPVYRPDITAYGATLNDLGGNALANANLQPKPRFSLAENGELQLHAAKIRGEIRRLGSGPRLWVQSSALYRWIQPRLFVLRARLAGKDQRILLGDFNDMYLSPSAADDLDWKLYGALVKRMRRVAEGNGSRFVFFAHPGVGEAWDPYIASVCEHARIQRSAYDPFAVQRRSARVAAENGVTFIEVLGPFRAHPERGPFHLLPYDGHLNANGHRLLAEVLADPFSSA